MPTLGIIGSGNIGAAVARLAVAVRIPVVVANSRGPESLAGLIAELGPLATAGTVDQAAEAGDFVLLSVPLTAYTAIPPAPLKGKTMLDTSNYYPFRDGRVAELDDEKLTTSELVQRHFDGVALVKAFNNILAHHIPQLARPSGAPDRTALPIASDDGHAKTEALPSLTGSVSKPSMPARWRRAGGSSRRPPPTPGSTSSTRPRPLSTCSKRRARRYRPQSCGPRSTRPSGCGWPTALSDLAVLTCPIRSFIDEEEHLHADLVDTRAFALKARWTIVTSIHELPRRGLLGN